MTTFGWKGELMTAFGQRGELMTTFGWKSELIFNSPSSLDYRDYGCLWCLPAYLFYCQKGIVLPFYVQLYYFQFYNYYYYPRYLSSVRVVIVC